MATNHGKTTLTVFIGLVMILLISSTSIAFFLYNKEMQKRQETEAELQNVRNAEMKLQADLKEARRQLTVLQDKNKEADDKINNLMDEMDLNEGLRKELKAETVSLKEQIEAAKKEKDKIKEEMDGAQKKIDEAERKYREASEFLKSEQDKSNSLQATVKELQDFKSNAQSQIDALKAGMKPYNNLTVDEQIAAETLRKGDAGRAKVNLDKIVVDPDKGTRGRILSVDKEAEFIVCNLGLKQGIKTGDILGIYRGEEYLGDVRVSRVQEDLCAADIIPPFSSRMVRKNDAVVFKP